MAKTATKKHTRTESDVKLVDRMEKFWKEAEEGNASWLERSVKNFDFYVGKQWDPVDLAKLKKEKRPALTVNHILSTLNLLSGMEREERNDIKVFPRKGGNQVVSEIFTGLCKHSMDMSDGEFEQSMSFLDGGIGGKGWLSLDISYEKDVINGDILLERRSFIDIKEDPNAKTYDINKSAKYVIRSFWGDKDQTQ
ncbi:unnamed protein product, partial [marine sediment metagenome]